MYLTFVVQFLFIIFGHCCNCLNAVELRFSQPVGTVGENFTVTCAVSNNTGNIVFWWNNTRVCTILNASNNGSCNSDVKPYEKSFTCTCDPVNKMYTVYIEGLFLDQIHNSQWHCEQNIPYTRSLKSEPKTLSVNVPVSSVTLFPDLNDLTSVIVEENKPKTLECKTNPIRPSARIQWYINEKNITSSSVPKPETCITDCGNGKVISSSAFVYTGTRNETGMSVYCAAVNIDGYLPVNSSAKEIDVQYSPSEIRLSTPNPSMIVHENENIGPILCNASCNPSCTYTWSGPGIDEMVRVLQINKIRRTHTGVFTCTAKNSIGMIHKDINILVHYPPSIKQILVSGGVDTVPEKSDVQLTCIAEGEPVPKISWNFLDALGKQTVLETDVTRQSEYYINKTKCEDTGRYDCVAESIPFQSSTASVDLNVTCSPKENIICSTNTSITVPRNAPFQINVCWIANPAPEATWTLVSANNTNVTSTLMKINPISYKSVLEKTIAEFTTIVYKVEAKNSQGTAKTLYFTIVVNGTATTNLSTKATDRLHIISGTVGSVSFALITCIGVIIIFKYRKSQAKGVPSDSQSVVAHCYDSAIPVYAQVKKTGTKNTNETAPLEHKVPVYAEVDKTKPGSSYNDEFPLYSAVKKNNKKLEKKDSFKSSKSSHIQTNGLPNTDETALVYIEVAFDNNKKGQKFEIREQEQRTEYGVIDFTKKADRLPSDVDEPND